jgi:hypothetical protein
LEKLKKPNSIDKKTSLFLNSLKKKFQEEKDSLFNEYSNFVKSMGKFVEKQMEKMKEAHVQELRDKFNTSKNHIFEQYFIHKYDKYKGVNFSEKSKIIIEKDQRKKRAYNRLGKNLIFFLSNLSLIKKTC